MVVVKDDERTMMCVPDETPIKRRGRKKETLADLTENMRTALIHCTSRGVRPTEFGDRWPIATRDALMFHGLIHLTKNRKGRDVYRPTDTGLAVVAAHTPRLLKGRPGRSDYTHLAFEAMRFEGEAA